MPGRLIQFHTPKQNSPATRLAASRNASVVQIPTVRKRGNPQLQQIKQSAASGVPPLIESVKLDIVARWRRGVAISSLAKMFQVSVRGVERILWAHHYGMPQSGDPMAAPTVRETRTLHVIARAA